MTPTTTTTEITLDTRRRTSLAKVGHKEHRQYLVQEQPDGTLTLIPAITISHVELSALADPATRAAMDRARTTKQPMPRRAR